MDSIHKLHFYPLIFINKQKKANQMVMHSFHGKQYLISFLGDDPDPLSALKPLAWCIDCPYRAPIKQMRMMGIINCFLLAHWRMLNHTAVPPWIYPFRPCFGFAIGKNVSPIVVKSPYQLKLWFQERSALKNISKIIFYWCFYLNVDAWGPST